MGLIMELTNLEELCASFGGSEKLLVELRDKLRDWLILQPHLPQGFGNIGNPTGLHFTLYKKRIAWGNNDIPNEKLEWLILSTKMSLELAKSKVDMYFTIKSLVPELFANRDPRDPRITTVLGRIQHVVLPKLTPDNCRTGVTRITSKDASKFCPWEFQKHLLMISDILIMEDRNLSVNFIVDFSMLSLAHLVKVTPTFLKKCEIAATKAYGARIRGIHYINAPPFIDRLVALLRSVLKPKLAERIHVHPLGDWESLYKFIPKSILPKDYGGDEQSMDELSALWRGKMDQYRDWFLKDQQLLVNERLRPGPALDADSLFGFSGSFRKLEVD